MKLIDYVSKISDYFWQDVEKHLESNDNTCFIDNIPNFITKITKIINTPNFAQNTKNHFSKTFDISLSMNNIKNIPSMKCILLIDKWFDNIPDIDLRKKTMRWWRKNGINKPHAWYCITSESKNDLKPFPEYVIEYISKNCTTDFQHALLQKILKVEEDILTIEKSNWKQILKLRYESFYYSTIWLLYQERLSIFGTDDVAELIKYIDTIPIYAYVGMLYDDSYDYEEDIIKNQKTLFTCAPYDFNTKEWNDFIIKIMNSLGPLINLNINKIPEKYKEKIKIIENDLKSTYGLYPHTYNNTHSLLSIILYTSLFLVLSNITNQDNLNEIWRFDIKETFKDINL